MGSRLQWTPDLSVGVDLIDRQHREWISRFNDLEEAVGSLQGPDRIAETLGFLIDYTGFHFDTEERHMEACDYPDLPGHRARHAELRSTLSGLVTDFEEDGATHSLAEAIDTFLGNWLVDHIRSVDARLGDYMRERGLDPND